MNCYALINIPELFHGRRPRHIHDSYPDRELNLGLRILRGRFETVITSLMKIYIPPYYSILYTLTLFRTEHNSLQISCVIAVDRGVRPFIASCIQLPIYPARLKRKHHVITPSRRVTHQRVIEDLNLLVTSLSM